jgi:hypothetical protein
VRRLVLGLMLLLACRGSRLRQIHFAREEVDVVVRPGTVEVTGVYHIANLSADTLLGMFFYPFPLDSLTPYPDSISLPGMYYTRSDTGLLVRMKLPARAEESMRVYYRQQLRANRALYIVTTTRRWPRPIDRAAFRVTVPAGLQGARVSFEPDSVEHTDSTLTWLRTFTKFRPAEDVIVTWDAADSAR